MAKVLVIDDAAFMRMAIKRMLVNNGFEIAGEAENGVVGVKKYMECKPDMVTMDITMPEMNGLDALKTIMQLDPEAKIVMVSAMGQQSMVKQAIISGAKSFIIKPFREEQVIKTLQKIV